MNEYEARAKWCPFARCTTAGGLNPEGQPTLPAPSFNRFVGPVTEANKEPELFIFPARCIGSACMAWRASPASGFGASFDVNAAGGGVEGDCALMAAGTGAAGSGAAAAPAGAYRPGDFVAQRDTVSAVAGAVDALKDDALARAAYALRIVVLDENDARGRKAASDALDAIFRSGVVTVPAERFVVEERP